MLRVHISQAKPGMTLALPVYHPKRHDTVLLKAEIPLDARLISRLREIKTPEVWVRYPQMSQIAEYASPAVYEAQAEVAGKVSEAFDRVLRGAHARLDFPSYRRAVGTLIDRLIASPKSALFLQEMIDRSEPALRHASTVCVLSVLMGLKLGDYLVLQRSRMRAWNARDVTDLGVGAMLHDVGMLRLDAETLQRWNTTRDTTDPQWRRHVDLGWEMVREGIGPVASAGVLHHHQRFDGSGFPGRRRPGGLVGPVSGEQIHIFARIVAAADIFDRLRDPASDPGSELYNHPRNPTVRALRQMREPPIREWIDPMVYKALLSVVPPYAPGTLVRLSTGRDAVVTEWFPADPCRPIVREVDLESGLDLDAEPGEHIDLRGQEEVQVVQVEGQDVSHENFYPDNPHEFELNLAGLFNRAAERGNAA